MSKWIVTAKGADFNSIGSHFGIDPVVARVIRNRDITSMEDINLFLNGTNEELHDGYGLGEVEKALNILREMIEAGKHIRIIGDYDVDGVTSTCILFKGIRAVGGIVDYSIPNRIADGYGININIVDKAIGDGVDCIITCDNGIAAKEAMEYAMEKGITCVITDHHEVPFEADGDKRRYILPEVDAIVNPKLEGSTYPYKKICGAFIAYKLMLLLLKDYELRENISGSHTNLIVELRQMAALGTVCDVCELKDENRILVKNALRDMQTTSNMGLRALIKVCAISHRPITAYDCGFILGPCINATGRLEDAALSLELLLEEEPSKADALAIRLRELNEKRKSMTESGLKEAVEAIGPKDGLGLDRRILVVYLPTLHESLAGIVAGRLREKYYRPVFVITGGEDGLKGSGRSIEGYHMYEEMNKVSFLFTKFGGHAMAAGLSMKEDKLEEFDSLINKNCTLKEDNLEETVRIDVPMPLGYVTEELINQLGLLEPFGAGNPKPVFAWRDCTFKKGRLMGAEKNMARFTIGAEGGTYDAVLFRGLDEFAELVKEKYGEAAWEGLFSQRGASEEIRLSITYSPGINEYMGRRTIQFVIDKFKYSDG